ncbi:NDP-sugar epimerase, includes UDP-GlcNAc-inverting 4,6-dehydratase FlaA1 and capsular polysaccharide biosynthesis protein EpsC [Sulfitobacter brevis]|uniref:NDP-sugar epimerase, includes UDP-GlcNAc-inverting 4,6-dehydratase FlaA1 and capsular polysaccharide biosynthesis protein EpsC n=1 Tax=Sulfitobacter brevis TaxID=74348 RepID=A0A1I1YM40_9RHOB|nr:nucleoside-diphosphate sugar epimerase/dehydratase [Sulfitobacter brevis]SFE19213.1 NDP-sugar epimerase, includes UDP-GlcNAc-inverting 4,6-dehydratase FlaA1 and capsular polysaccharide biosynthesis protein EpsC [Sulfitobacter brevis]
MLNFLTSLTKRNKRVIMLALDSVLVLLSVLFALSVHGLSGTLANNFVLYMPVLPYVLLIGIGVSIWLGVCSIRLNAYETAAIGMTGVFALFLVFSSLTISNIMKTGLPLGVHLVFGAAFFSLVVISRAVLLQLVLAVYRRSKARCRVLIYGAGTTGTQLVSALRSHELIEAVAFVDDNVAIQGLTVAHLPVYNPLRIAEVAREKKINRVLLAVPSLSPPKQAQIARRLEKMGLEVQMLPSFAQLIGEEALVDKLEPVLAHRFLNRDEVTNPLIDGAGCYRGKVVMVSGAGGSIGSELCRQVLVCRPDKLVLFELSELALYQIDMELSQITDGTKIKIVPVLGSITDTRQVRKVLTDHKVEIILHAAAYKHVPLVEANPLSGLVNNVFGTQALAEQAAKAGVERFILISSDKAVRPTNIMGASKRLAELVVQDLARRHGQSGGPIFSMVRFGNVLGSSGSVVPLFQDQLSRGGPLTVTDPSVSRYFMTVQEAVKLVLQAGAIAKGGEVFVLDMGKPVAITQLARQVIESAGYTVRDANNPDGDIEIEFTGLRPGEKMTEELTLSGALLATVHPKIFAADELGLSQIEIASALRRLREAYIASDEDMARSVVHRWVEGFEAATQIRLIS